MMILPPSKYKGTLKAAIMYTVIPLVATLMLCCDVALAQQTSNKMEWSPEEMYNPITEPRNCGLNKDEPAYICDPNGIVGDEINTFQWILRQAADNGTRCPCSTYFCEHHRGFKGYRIGVALVNRMKLQKGEGGEVNTPENQAQICAYHLENTKWKMGKCDEDIIIFYSVEDKVLAMYGGRTANMKLTPYYRQLLAYKVNGHLQSGRVIEALHNLIYDLKILLNCQSKEHDCGIHESRRPQGGSAGNINTSFGAVTLMSIIFISSFISQL